jgi:glucose-6-phosphate-specific signal transduction histidine kinase
MGDIAAGILFVLIGAVFCYRGYLTMRLVLPLWGFLVGFSAGAGLMATITGDGFLGTALGWTAGFVLGVLFGVLAYAYFAVAVMLTMAFLGFTLTTGFLGALGVTWNWVLVLAGTVVGALVGVATLVVDMPQALLTVLTALGGAIVMVVGAMLVFDRIDLDEFDRRTVTDQIQDRPMWVLVGGLLFITGLIAQVRFSERLDADLRTRWDAQSTR